LAFILASLKLSHDVLMLALMRRDQCAKCWQCGSIAPVASV